jgi:hypothetical protein
MYLIGRTLLTEIFKPLLQEGPTIQALGREGWGD